MPTNREVSKTNVTARKGKSDMRPKSELRIFYIPKFNPNTRLTTWHERRVFVPINREVLA